MEYTINKLARLAGVSTRTLRYYDQIGLLTPNRISANGYRVYGQREVDILQQILFYRELSIPLKDICAILRGPQFEPMKALTGHLVSLTKRRDQLDTLINNVKKTIQSMKGELTMSDQEKFEGFIERLITENEEKYGEEVRAKYSEEAINNSNAKLRGMSKEQYEEMEKLTQELNNTLKAAFEQGDPASPLAQQACALHKKWLCYYWDHYSKEAHIGLTQMYVDDPRFTAYYDKIAKGCAAFLRDAVQIFCT